MTTLTDTTLSALRAKAEEATPGPWTVVRDPVKHWPAWVEGPSTHPSIPSPDVVCSPSYSDRFSEDDVKNMEYIAAANPTTILALLDALEEARRATPGQAIISAVEETISRPLLDIELRHVRAALMDTLLNGDGDPASLALIFSRITSELATLRARVIELEDENSTLASGICIVDGGLIGDEGGTPYCTLRVENEKLREIIRLNPNNNRNA